MSGEIEERLAALEARNQALQTRIDELEGGVSAPGPAPQPASTEGARVDRRSLLRNLGGAAAAGVGLFAAQSVTSAQPALADHGGVTVVTGDVSSDPSDRMTTIQAAADYTVALREDVLRVVNDASGTALRVVGDGGVAPLVIQPNGTDPIFGDSGALHASGNDTYSDLYYYHSGDNGKTGSPVIAGKVLTTNFAQYIDFPAGFPLRAVETRDGLAASPKKNHPNGSGPISGTHTIDISSELPAGVSGVMGSLTVVPQGTSPGFLRFWAEGDEPNTANLAWSAGQLETTSIVTDVTSSGTFQVYLSGAAHVVLDLQAVIKND